ncbi:choice-of-anchor Q domain-containing protein [Solirubrobacter soli]|uniref:choice-of-anchor Q domain-containing protein n=1 Tax=Solirubrobacter soli TaxID=363832 RepID=UPI0003F99FF6|nr:choice-of-anchor Q domain-containing protein [Solirubrobacter soli]
MLTKPGKPVEIAASGRGVKFDGLDIKADNVILRGMSSTSYLTVDSGNAADPVENVRLYDMHTATHFLLGVKHFVWKRGSIGPSVDEKASMIGGTPTSYDITYDHVTWHDATRTSGDVHTECLLALGVQGLTIRNSRFTNCAVFDILLSRIGADPPPRNVVIENTVLEKSIDLGDKPGFYSLMTGADPLDGLTLRNNVWDLGLALQGPIANGHITGNIGRAASCADGVRYTNNVFTDKRCDRSDRVVPSAFTQFVDPREGNWRLKPRAAAINAGDPKAAPTRDAGGHSRTGKPDAGAYEYRGG